MSSAFVKLSPSVDRLATLSTIRRVYLLYALAKRHGASLVALTQQALGTQSADQWIGCADHTHGVNGNLKTNAKP